MKHLLVPKLRQISTPPNPDTGFNSLYFKTDNKLYKKTSAGVESSIEGTSDHSALSNLDYASAGHTGFSPDTHNHDGRYLLLAGGGSITGGITTTDDIEVSDDSKGIVLNSVSFRWRITIDDDGNIYSEKL